MTPLSWDRVAEWPASLGKHGAAWITAPWHVACFLLGSQAGCIYLGPTPELESNVPPEVVSKNPEPGEGVVIGPNGLRVFVVAVDPDGEAEVRFVWWLSGDGVIGDAEPLQDGSSVVLDYDPELDGQTLRCDIYEVGGDGGGASDALTLSWELEVL